MQTLEPARMTYTETFPPSGTQEGDLAQFRQKCGAELGRFEEWVVKNASWLALAIIAAAFALRLDYAGHCYLNADEASHFEAARPSSWLDAYKASFGLAHPPLFVLVLHAALFLGRSESVVRLPSLLGGTAALWLAFAWIRRCLGAIPSLAGLGFMALSPAAISASTEVRQYGLLLCFVCGALYATERTFTARSTAWAVVQGLFLACALLTHYTAIIVLVCLCCYVSLCLLLRPAPRRIILTFCSSLLVLATLEGWLYFGRVRGQKWFGSTSNLEYLRHFYYSGTSETPLGFFWRAMSGTFLYSVGIRRLAFLFMLAFLVGLWAIAAGRTRAPRYLALLLVSPFVVGFACAIIRVFPFAGSRHQAYLLPFLAATLAASLACLPRKSAVLFLLAGVVIAPFWVARARPDNDPRTVPLSNMIAATQYIDGVTPPGAPLFTDYDTRAVLRYYFTRNDRSFDRLIRLNAPGEEQLGRYRVVVPQDAGWNFRPDEVLQQVAQSAQVSGVPPCEPLRIVSLAWWAPSLAAQLPLNDHRQAKEFGLISVMKVLSPKC
jgi:hypothetical protein